MSLRAVPSRSPLVAARRVAISVAAATPVTVTFAVVATSPKLRPPLPVVKTSRTSTTVPLMWVSFELGSM